MNAYETLLDFYKNNRKRIERIVLPSGYIEYRIWSLSSTSYNGKVKSCGKTCKMKLFALPDESGFVEEEYLRKNKYSFVYEKSKEFYTEDFDFYESITGVNPEPFIGLSSAEFYDKINEKK